MPSIVCQVSRLSMELDRDDARRQRLIRGNRIGRTKSHGGWYAVSNYGDRGCTCGIAEGYIPHQEESNPKLSTSHSSGMTTAVKAPTRALLNVTVRNAS